MAYCSRCGHLIEAGARFCSSCGNPVAEETTAVAEAIPVQPVSYTTPTANPGYVPARSGNDYRLILVSLGTCRASEADDLLEDILGYSNADAKTLVKNTPIEIAHSLNVTQARYIAQALTEYGMQISVCNTDGYVDLGVSATQTVYNNDGSFTSELLGVLATISTVNQVRNFMRWTISDPYRYVFMPRYRPPRPPMHIRRPFISLHPAPHPGEFGPGPHNGPRGGGMSGGPRGGGMGGGPRGGGMGGGPRGGSMGGGPRGGGMGGGPRGGGMGGGPGRH